MFGKSKISYTEKVDLIQTAVYEVLKPLGFRKHGRTLHRFVSGDISQVVNFQIGPAYCHMNNLMWVNIGIRIPECDRVATQSPKDKKYYQEYECNIRCRLGEAKGRKETAFNLRKSADRISSEIVKELEKYVLPAFEVLNSREAILAHRRDYPNIDTMFEHLVLLDEVFIYLHLGDATKATEAFEEYYNLQIAEYEAKKPNNPNIKNHIEYLEELRKNLGFVDC